MIVSGCPKIFSFCRAPIYAKCGAKPFWQRSLKASKDFRSFGCLLMAVTGLSARAAAHRFSFRFVIADLFLTAIDAFPLFGLSPDGFD
jgi:hypothetical protein